MLKGAAQTLKNHKPILIFECGKGASDYYGTTPSAIYDYLDDMGYSLNTLKGFYRSTKNLDKGEFVSLFESGDEYYFVGR